MLARTTSVQARQLQKVHVKQLVSVVCLSLVGAALMWLACWAKPSRASAMLIAIPATVAYVGALSLLVKSYEHTPTSKGESICCCTRIWLSVREFELFWHACCWLPWQLRMDAC
eukprot:COSAG02_NODE_170_length_31534_cov_33.568498_18_plen_114_part_00